MTDSYMSQLSNGLSGSGLMMQQMYGMGLTIQNKLLNGLKFFKSDITNVIFQYFVLKIISGVDLGTIYKEVKQFLQMLYKKYMMISIFNMRPYCIKHKILNTPGTLGGRLSAYGAAGGNNSYVSQYGEIYVMNESTKAIIWKINQAIENNKNIKEIQDTNNGYLNEKVIGDGDSSNTVFIPEDVIGVKLESDIYVDVSTTSTPQTGSYGAYSTNGQNNCIVVSIYSWKRTIDQLKQYRDTLVEQYNDNCKKKGLNVQKVFVFGIDDEDKDNDSGNSPVPGMGMPGFAPPPNPSLNVNNKKDTKKPLSWKVYDFETNKSWESLFIENKDRIKKNIEWLTSEEGKQFYKKAGIPQHLTILAHGPPGTGKNSFFKVLTKCIFPEKHLIVIPPGSIKCFDDFKRIVHCKKICGINVPHEKRIYQLDEIDKTIPELQRVNVDQFRIQVKSELIGKEKKIEFEPYFQKRLTEERNKRTTELGRWLDFLDGSYEQGDRNIFFSANDIDKLHPDLTRGGRITLTPYFNLANKNIIVDIVRLLSGYNLFDKKIQQLINKLDDYKISQANVYKICTKNKVKQNEDDSDDYVMGLFEEILALQKEKDVPENKN